MNRWMWCALALCLLTGCRDGPDDVLESASEAAADGDYGDLEGYFTITTTRRLQTVWRDEGIAPGAGWKALAEQLLFSGAPLTIERAREETVIIRGDYARVMAKAGVRGRPYYLRKEDGQWRLDLGSGTRWRQARPADEAPAEGEAVEPKAEE